MAVDATRYRENVEQRGLSRTHRQVISWITPGARVLELGCSSGYIGRLLIDEKGCQVTGVEVDAAAAAEARTQGLTVLEGSLEDPAFRQAITDRFDFVVAADVLEHLRDPAVVLDGFKRWLAPGGLAIIAVPNIATWEIRQQLFFRGDFEYQEMGILDRTHLHFFTWITLHKLVAQQQWSVLDTMVERWDVPLVSGLLALFHGLGVGLERRGAQWVESLAKKWPNLCASHIALLLRPPLDGAA
jgi:methionine biosynthesis protein MetW